MDIWPERFWSETRSDDDRVAMRYAEEKRRGRSPKAPGPLGEGPL